MMKKLLILLVFAIPAMSVAVELSAGQKAAKDCAKKSKDHSFTTTCLWKTSKELNQSLEKTYADVLTEAREHDVQMRGLGNRAYEGKPHLNEEAVKKSQETFLLYKDAECTRISAQFDGDAGAGDAVAICEIDIITERLRSLK